MIESHKTRVRIGILGNGWSNDCVSCEFRIGFGAGGPPADSNKCTCGNEAAHEADNGGKHIKAMGYIPVYLQ